MKTKILTLLASLALFGTGAALSLTGPAPAEAAPVKPCQITTATGTAPCPPPIVSTNGKSIGGGANSEPVNMGDLPSKGSYSYEAPTWEPAEPEAPAEPEEPAEESAE
ncbi:hypothetical protein SEA_PUPPER_204 [Gordonia phage Pupper]|uniref:Uncharacterized protein n=1 Tax=Gordonia phage Pupper TaxID=2571249 RepID=A0A4Y6EIY1_9CAUD|nr:hypothetical protein KHQ83_gp073 [Gordonia phage Pupper]QDF18690.1 hypothetical protein SEA_PUPPER_204 [Gordonia phage Pupper]QDF18922.1 hypothetical protein SEA_SCENTAE_203 [Gordonia phage SCentae]